MKTTIIKIFISCCIYAFLSHQILSIDYGDTFTFTQSAFRSFIIYSTLFLGITLVPLTICILIAKIPKKNRLKPVGKFINYALIISWVISLFILRVTLETNQHLNSVNKLDSNSKEKMNDYIEEELKSLNRNTPLAINKIITLTSIDHQEGTIISTYLVSSPEFEKLDSKERKEVINEFSKNYFCSDPASIKLMNIIEDITWQWKYVNTDGILIEEVTLKAEDCKAR